MDVGREVISNYFITINTNESLSAMIDQGTVQTKLNSLKQTIKDLVVKDHIKKSQGGRFTARQLNAKIKAVKVTYAIEKGTIKDRLHAHLIISILHKTSDGAQDGIRLDYMSMRNKIKADLNVGEDSPRGLYFNAKIIYINSAENYLKKTEVGKTKTVFKGVGDASAKLPPVEAYDPDNPRDPLPPPLPKPAAKPVPLGWRSTRGNRDIPLEFTGLSGKQK